MTYKLTTNGWPIDALTGASINPDTNAKYIAWLNQENTPSPPDPDPPEVVAAKSEAAKYAADAADARSYAKLTALKTMSPAQVQAWVATNVTNLAQAQDAIATLAIGVCILARRI